MPLKYLQHMQHVQNLTIYFCNIKMKQSQHTSETSETLETYAGKLGRSNLVVGVRADGESHVRAPPVLPMLVGALGLAREDLRRHGTRASVAMTGSAACPTAIGYGWTTRERAAQVTGTQVRSVGSEDVRRSRRWREDSATAQRARGGQRGRTDERPHCFGQISILPL
jgi:hypothetical protein